MQWYQSLPQPFAVVDQHLRAVELFVRLCRYPVGVLAFVNNRALWEGVEGFWVPIKHFLYITYLILLSTVLILSVELILTAILGVGKRAALFVQK